MTKSATRIQDKDTQKRLSVVQSTEDPTKFGIVILNPDGTPVQGGGGNVKGFKLSSTSDITNAQKAYNWYKNGKVAIIIYNNKVYLFNQETGGNAYWCVANEKAYDTVTDTGLNKDTLQLAISSNTVTGITEMSLNINDFKVLRTDKDYGTPYTPQYDGSPATKKYVDDKVDNTAFGSGWDGDTTHAPSRDAVYDKVNGLVNDTAYGSGWNSDVSHAPSKNAVYNEINSIEGKIPSAATNTNQLADKDYVNDSINSITAYYITKNAQGDQFATYLELSTASTFYSGGVVRTPTRNDYCIVQADENHDNATTRYIYQNNQWEYQYTVNETALTTAQLNALNSGITAGRVSTYDGYASAISGKQDALNVGKGISINSSNVISNTLPGPTVSATAPSSPSEGDLWYDTTNDVLKSYNGTSWEEGGTKMTVLTYGTSTWQDFVNAYNNNAIVYCKVASGSAGYRMAFMAYVTGQSTPTSVEFQYYRSRSDHNTQANQLDEVYVYKLENNGTWTTTTRDTGAKIVAGNNVSITRGGGNAVINASGGLQVAPNSPITGIKYIWYGTESDYSNLSQYYTDTPGDTEFHTF